MSIGLRSAAAIAATAFLGLSGASPAVAAAPAGCENPAVPGQVIEQTPWQQRWLAPERVWPFSTGAGVRVAVIDSGSDASHPQLSDQIERGFDMLRNGSGGDFDCVSHGTAVASIIAARRQQGVGFAGLAPDAKILPVRVTEQDVDQGKGQGPSVPPQRFGQAIRQAVDDGADVVNLSVTLYQNDPDVESAVEYALSKDVVLVAAAGNLHQKDGKDPVPYPAAYDGVIGVGAIDETGARVDISQIGPYVDIVAPGGAVVAATRVRGHALWSGTSFATPMVSATVALIRSAEPDLTAQQVTKRLLATADPARGGVGQGYGQGVVNPYRAVTERLTNAPAQAQQGLPPVPYDPVRAARTNRWETIGLVAMWVALGVLAAAAVVAAVGLLTPYGRKRSWRPTRSEAVREPQPETDEPEEVFFRVPSAPTG